VDADGRDEVSRMAGDVNAMTERLRAVFSAVGETNGRLVGASTGLEDIAARVGRSAEEASSRAEVVARSADEVSQNVQAVASGSEEMGASISEIAQNANEAARVATGAVQAVESTTGTMNKLGDSSREIGDVVRLITSIAEQTNLLALNATIEAARAGDAGKGFAVVADEVKQLAQETARATEDISRRVETIQEDADQAARAIADIAGVITRINEFQTTIASAVEEQTATTQAINAGVTEAASGSNQIAHNIAGVADAAGQTATSMTDARDSARQLAVMSDELSRLIQGFRV
jgi:methyl-accepting chemotaxis protein